MKLVDPSRIEPFSPNHGYRELMVDVWYPAEPAAGAIADYLDAPAFERALGTAAFQQHFGNAAAVIKSGVVRTHAVSGAPFSRAVSRSPLLIFSPGGGLVRELYSAQIEDLVSHGYVVAAITHTYDGIVAVFPDGHVVTHDGARWPEIPSVSGEMNLNQLEWHARDITFVVDELSRTNAVTSSASPFAGHLQLSQIGAFGHSVGGIAAAHACQIDRRIKACLNQDGAVAMKPYFLDARGWGMDQPFMLIERSPRTAPPSDQELAAMKLTRPQADELIARLRHDKDATLRSTAEGSYRVVLESAPTTHGDFTDLPYLGASTEPEAAARAKILAVVRSWTLAFFDETLRGKKQSMLATQSPHELVQTVQRFPPAKRAW